MDATFISIANSLVQLVPPGTIDLVLLSALLFAYWFAVQEMKAREYWRRAVILLLGILPGGILLTLILVRLLGGS